MNINLFADINLFVSGFYDPGQSAIDFIPVSASLIRVNNTATGVSVLIEGSGFSNDPETAPTGTVQSITLQNGTGAKLAEITNVSWSFVEFGTAVYNRVYSNDSSGLTALLNQQAITLDLSGVPGPFDAHGVFDDVTSAVTITGNAYGNRLQGGDGNDSINPGSTAADSDGDLIFGSAGQNTIDLSFVQQNTGYVGLVYDGFPQAISVVIDGPNNIGNVFSSIHRDTLINVSRALDWNTNGFSIFGTAANDSFQIDGGNETWIDIAGGMGTDSYDLTLSGTVRIDFFQSWGQYATQGANIDVGMGRVNNDGFGNVETLTLTGGSGQLELFGTQYADVMIGSTANERFIGNSGNDTIDGGGGFDLIRYDRGEARSGVDVNLASGQASGTWFNRQSNAQESFVHQLSNIEDVRGTKTFADRITGSDANERMHGFGGNDTLLGAGGDDTLNGNDGNDLLGGGAGNDALFGNSGNDIIYGGLGDDFIGGDDGNDLIYGSAGSNTIHTGDGMDTVHGGTGNDTIHGEGGQGNTLLGNGGDDLVFAGAGTDLIGGGAGDDRLYGGEGANTIYLGAGNDLAGGGAGNDVIYGGAGTNTIYGGLGDDTVRGGVDGDTIYGGGSGRNVLLGNDGDDVIYAGSGTDFMAGGAGNDELYGGAGNNIIYLGGGDDFVGGGAGVDVIYAGVGNNRIYGGTGNDYIVAGTGKDISTGGPGADVFIFHSAAQAGIGAARDVITDFTVGIDKIQLVRLDMTFVGGAAFTGTAGELRYIPGFVVGDVDGNGQADFAIEISGAPALTADDFIL